MLFPSLRRCSKCAYYNWYHSHAGKIQVLVSYFTFFDIHSMVRYGKFSFLSFHFFFFCKLALGLTFRPGFCNPFVLLLLLLFTPLEFFTSVLLRVFHWSFSDSKSPEVFGTLLSILAVLNNAVVWMASTRPPTSKYSSPFSSPLVTVPNAQITIGIIVTVIIIIIIIIFIIIFFYSFVSFSHQR